MRQQQQPRIQQAGLVTAFVTPLRQLVTVRVIQQTGLGRQCWRVLMQWLRALVMWLVQVLSA
jgi:hypothetical protein